MTYGAVVYILLRSYSVLYDFLSLPEGQWLRIIKDYSPGEGVSLQLEFFPQGEEPNFENYKTKAYVQAIEKE